MFEGFAEVGNAVTRDRACKRGSGKARNIGTHEAQTGADRGGISAQCKVAT